MERWTRYPIKIGALNLRLYMKERGKGSLKTPKGRSTIHYLYKLDIWNMVNWISSLNNNSITHSKRYVIGVIGVIYVYMYKGVSFMLYMLYKSISMLAPWCWVFEFVNKPSLPFCFGKKIWRGNIYALAFGFPQTRVKSIKSWWIFKVKRGSILHYVYCRKL